MSDTSRDEVRSFLIGSLLGDCYANGLTAQWHWGNIDRQYVEWKAAYVRKHLGTRSQVWVQKDDSCRDGVMYCFTAAGRNGRLRVYRDWFYDSDNVKRITRKVQHLTHPLGLVVLILDQGSCRGGPTHNHCGGGTYYRKPSIRLHLNAHSEPELQLFQGAMHANFGLETSLQRKSNGYLDVYFGTKATQELWTQIRSYVPDIAFANKKFHPLISQTANAHMIRRPRGVHIKSGSESCSGRASIIRD